VEHVSRPMPTIAAAVAFCASVNSPMPYPNARRSLAAAA
jgi:hypothetical protein